MQRLNSARTYSEMYAILEILGDEYVKKVPKKLYNFICDQRDLDYNPELMTDTGTLDESQITKETLAMFAILNVKYFMQSEEEKNDYMRLLRNNEREYQIEQMQKYNPANLFRKWEEQIDQFEEDDDKNVELVEYKESLFTKIINKIKGFFNKK